MKIGMIHLNLATESGDPRMFLSIAQGLRRLGHEIAVYAAEFDREKCFPDLNRNLDIHVVPPRAPLMPVVDGATGLAGRIAKRVARNRLFADAARRIGAVLPKDLDVLVCQNDQSFYVARMYKLINPGARTVWIMNNAPFYSSPKGSMLAKAGSVALAVWGKMKVKYYLRGIDVVVVHDAERKKMIDALGVSAVMIHIPVDFESFYESVRRRGDSKEVMLLSVGSLSPFRKFEDTVRAAAELRRAGYDARVILVCKDFWGDDGYRATLLRLTEETNMAPFVDFRFEGISEEELRRVQQKSDVFVFPQHINIWSMAAFEAMAAGLPLVVSSATSVAEALVDGHDALFFHPGNVAEIALKVKELIKSPEMYAEIAENGQRFVKEFLNWDRYINEFLHSIQKPLSL